MEKTLSQEERIRRAEEIYYRRKMSSGGGIRVSGDSVNVKKSKLSLFKKMALQLAICAVIYIIFYLIKNTNYIFSEDVINKTKEWLSYDINFEKVYKTVSTFIEDNKEKLNVFGNVENNLESNEVSNEVTNQITNEATNTVEVNQVGIGGAESNEIIETSANDTSKKTQMELDAEYVKSKCTFKVPLKGEITSRYGTREKTEIISANHQGIDIGGNIGTAIYSAMEGTVTLVSSEGDYRKTH